MADPRDVPVQKRRQNLSPLLKAQAEATTGEKVNFCPFGCTMDDIDDHGYCDHLVGFTNDGKQMEPMVKDGVTGRRVVMGAQKKPVQKGDVLVPISISQRVYRDRADKLVKAEG